MARALTLAELGWGRVHPNPLVGAVIVQDGVIVGEGWHGEFGGLHAEAMALDAAGGSARGATLYVTLEPCNHHGKQPPCVDAILAAGVARVVAAMSDPNPEAGGGIERLRKAGVAVELGVLGDAAERLNAPFLERFHPRSRPFTAVKLAVSLDGQIADEKGRSRWLSGEEARAWVHRLRAGYGALGLGASSLLADNARLTVRGAVTPRQPPIRVIFDRSGRVGPAQGIFADVENVPVWMIVNSEVPAARTAALEQAGATVLVADGLGPALAQLRERGVESLLVEGGGRLAGALLAEGLLDRVYQVTSPLWLGEGRQAWAGLGAPNLGEAIRWQVVERRALGADSLLVLEP
ncbi:MAG: bifunctional diaminohydroxyphosphoribosylaminopyrimidine deaminase/5-amino-6-(5-phosphoribosylamino)uracil reductase RibD [Gemmatimonadota bacterium]